VHVVFVDMFICGNKNKGWDDDYEESIVELGKANTSYLVQC
jgi:hypothetical protein